MPRRLMLATGHERPTFDVYMVEDDFPRAAPPTDLDKNLTTAILERNTLLTPSVDETAALVAFSQRVEAALENLSIVPTSGIGIEYTRAVGSFKKGTLTKNRMIADLVVVLTTMPIKDKTAALGEALVAELVKMDPTLQHLITSIAYEGFLDLIYSKAAVRVRLLIATTEPNYRRLDPKCHWPAEMIAHHLNAIKHVGWFEEVSSTALKALVRILKDIAHRYVGLKALSPWIIEVLAHHVLTFRKPDIPPYTIDTAFRRFFQLISAGLLLPGAMGIPDPCAEGYVVQSSLSYDEMEAITMTCQTLLQVMSQGTSGYRLILGLMNEDGDKDCTQVYSIWDKGVVITPGEPVLQEKAAQNSGNTEVAVN